MEPMKTFLKELLETFLKEISEEIVLRRDAFEDATDEFLTESLVSSELQKELPM